MNERNVNIQISNDQALVLFDWLVRFNRMDSHPFVDQAEQRVLWDLEAMLESELEEPLSRGYEDLLSAARGRVRDASG